MRRRIANVVPKSRSNDHADFVAVTMWPGQIQPGPGQSAQRFFGA
jgi:hypothetical protein